MKCHLVRQLFSFIDRFLSSWKGIQMILSRMKNEAHWADSSSGLAVACEGAKGWARDGPSLADPLFSLCKSGFGGKSLSFARRRWASYFLFFFFFFVLKNTFVEFYFILFFCSYFHFWHMRDWEGEETHWFSFFGIFLKVFSLIIF